MAVFDTNLLIEYLRGNERVVRLFERYRKNDEIRITIINAYEILKGSRSVEQPVLQRFLARFPVLYLDDEAASHSARIYQDLRREGKQANDTDVLISGICISNKAKLVTMDKDFTRIRGIDLILV